MACADDGTFVKTIACNKNSRSWTISKVLKLSCADTDPVSAAAKIHLSFSNILRAFLHCPVLYNYGVIHIFVIPSYKSFLHEIGTAFDRTHLTAKTFGLDKITKTKNYFLIHPFSNSDFFLFTKLTKNKELFRVFDTERLAKDHVILKVNLEDILKATDKSNTRIIRDVSLRKTFSDKSREKVVPPKSFMYEVIAFPLYPTQASDEQNVPEKTSYAFNGFSRELNVHESANSDRGLLLATETRHESQRDHNTLRYHRHTSDLPPARFPEYADYKVRMDSYINWTSERHNPVHLSKAGFFYTGNGDLVRCFQCGVGLKDFITDIVPTIEHARYSPDCKFLEKLVGTHGLTDIKRNLISSDPNCIRQSNGDENYGNQGHYRHPEYQRFDDRLATFYSWPSILSQTPNQLAEAGFFYTGYEDMVRCFSCNGGLKSWEVTDDPWTEHCRWFPSCRYANEIKGGDYIALVQAVIEADAEGAQSELDLSAAIGELTMSDPNTLLKEREYKATCLELGYKETDFNSTLTELKNRGNLQPTMDDILDLIDIIKENERKQQAEPKYETPLEENKRLKSYIICMNCQENDCNALFLPCGHRKVCMSCAEPLEECLVCGRPIRVKMQTYLA
ncbi:hypothetical protein ACF0H5_018217 [Mactra antiquata]